MDQNSFNCQQVISAMGERVILLDTSTNRVDWLSEPLLHDFPSLSAESTIDQVIEAIDNHSAAENRLKGIVETLKLNEQKYGSKRCGQYSADIYRLDKCKSLIRLQDATLIDEANGRHLEDREKLIFTARRITVSEMASTLAHELNQPVGTINNLLQGIRDRLITSETTDSSLIHAIDKSIEQARYTSDIIQRIRDYTRSRQPNISVIDLISLINKCISLMDWEMRNTRVVIEHRQCVDSAFIQGDELMLQQVIVNLIRNGMEAMTDQKKVIVITTDIEDVNCKITIKDNGKGISSDQLETIFIPFFSNKSSGMGIGLNICRSFIELHRGKIWLTKNEDFGCTSHLLLPTHAEGSL